MNISTNISAKDAAQRITVKVNVSSVREYRFRLWIATQLIRFACWISWNKCEVVERKI